MLEAYLTEIIAVVAILVVSVIYFIIKTSKPKNINELDSIVIDKTEAENIVKDEYDTEEPEISLASTPVQNNHIEETPKVNTQVTSRRQNLKKADVTKMPVPKHGKISKDDFNQFAGKRILVAEDNLINQKVIAGLLGDSGIEVVMADNGQEALDTLENDSDFSIVLMDAHMPVVDGFEATTMIRANPDYNHIVVVALSGDTASDDIRKMNEVGMQEHLEKPLKMDALYDILYAYTGTRPERKKVVKVKQIQELNVKQGLEICGGDNEFYLEILNEFVTTYSNSSKNLTNLLENHNELEADKLLLDLLGITANIGAKSLHDIALDLKEAVKDLEEKSYITILEQYEKQLQVLLSDIKDYIK